MAYAEKRGKGPKPWRVKYKRPDGAEGSQSGFETKKAALAWGRAQEAQAGQVGWVDPQAGEITVGEWASLWMQRQDMGLATAEKRKYLLGRFIIPQWGSRTLKSLATEEINKWEAGLPSAMDVSLSTGHDARSLLSTMLGDAATARPHPLIPFNPALRQRNRGKRTGRRLAVSPPRTWATPLETLLIAERAALLSGHDDDFRMLITIGYTGMRWGEAIGLEREFCLPGLINLEWQLHEIKGAFHRLPPKDDSYRSLNWEPRVPIDLLAFLAAILAEQAECAPRSRCACAGSHGGSGDYLFTGPEGGHHRRSNYARRVFRPACDGRYEPEKGRPGKLVIIDADAFPGRPVASWAPAGPGATFEPPHGRGTARLVNEGTTGRCPACGRSVMRCTDGGLTAHAIRADPCPGSGQPPAEDPVLAAWLPVKTGLTPHGLRHSHKTWMVEEGTPEILAELRLGHMVPGMRGLYSHVSDRMREELRHSLQLRWEESLNERAALSPTSPVPALDRLLAPIRERQREPRARAVATARTRKTKKGGENLASQIPPKDGADAASEVV